MSQGEYVLETRDTIRYQNHPRHVERSETSCRGAEGKDLSLSLGMTKERTTRADCTASLDDAHLLNAFIASYNGSGVKSGSTMRK